MSTACLLYAIKIGNHLNIPESMVPGMTWVYRFQSGALKIVTCPNGNGGGLHAEQAAVRVATSPA